MTFPLATTSDPGRTRPELSRLFGACVRRSGLLLLALSLSACNTDWLPHA